MKETNILNKSAILYVGPISKRGKLYLGKRGGRLPKNARRSRKPLQKDWITGRRPPTLKSADKSAKYKLRPRRHSYTRN
ncbi:MAG TPA: hypothetical protein VE566_04265 [Nitrososphaeraceae archaeon]|nr:hypothetical protein [Nitrososphaeraceae archaeon]